MIWRLWYPLLLANPHWRIWWSIPGSNRWHSACKADALPTELIPQIIDRVKKASNKQNKMQERGIQTSKQFTKNKMHKASYFQLSMCKHNAIIKLEHNSTEVFKTMTMYESHTSCLFSSLSSLWVVYGYSKSLTRLTTKTFKECLPFPRSEQFLRLVQFLFEHLVQAAHPVTSASHACYQQHCDGSLQFLHQ